jgi:L-alanine-DL-glutamate epimerase-like enolase superfamily enzyme
VSTAIADIRIHSLSIPLTRPFWMSLEPYRVAAEVVVEIETDEGLVGIGQIHGRPQGEIVAILQRFRELLLGEDPLDHALVYETLFRLTYSRAAADFVPADGQPHFGASAKPQVMAAIAGIDIALWDVKAKLTGQPLWKLLGGARRRVRAYASGGYYGPDGDARVDELVEEMKTYYDLGFGAVKMKVGGLPLEEDIERVRAVREALPDVQLMLDANSAWNVPSAIEAARAFESFAVHWLEEPVAWFDPVFGLARLGESTNIPLASGERELHRFACRDLIDHTPIRYMQFDCTRAGGITEWLRVAAYASAHGVWMAPHHDPQVHGHLVAAAENGYIVEVFPNEARDPVWEGLFAAKPAIEAGEIVLSGEPGLGIELDFEFVDYHRTVVV